MKLRFERWIPAVMVLLAVPLLMAQVVNRPSSGGGTTGGATSNYVNSSVATASNSLVAQISAAQVWTYDTSGGDAVVKTVDQTKNLALLDYNNGNVLLSTYGPYPDFSQFARSLVMGNTWPAGPSITEAIIAGDGAGVNITNGADVICIGESTGPTSPASVASSVFMGNNAGCVGNVQNVFVLANTNYATAANQFIVGNAANQVIIAGGRLIADIAKTTNTPPFDVAALLSAYNGVATLLRTTATNSLITVGSSPFNFTNTAAQTIVLYLDANGATTAVKLNGTQIFASLVAGDHTLILKPGAYTTVTYSLATPVMTWTEL